MRGINSPLLAFWFHAQVVRGIVWAGLILLTIALLLLMRTRWGQARPLRKCIVLSLLVHLLLAIYTTTVHIVTGAGGPFDGGGAGVRVAILDPQEDGDDQGPFTTDLTPSDALTADEVPPSDIDTTPPEGHDPQQPGPELMSLPPTLVKTNSAPSDAAHSETTPSAAAVQTEAAPATSPAGSMAAKPTADAPIRPSTEPADEAAKTKREHESTQQPPERSEPKEPQPDQPPDADVPPPPTEPRDDTPQDPTNTPRPPIADATRSPDTGPSSAATTESPADRVPANSAATGSTVDGRQNSNEQHNAGATPETPRLVPVERPAHPRPVPNIYKARVAPDRTQIAEGNGGSKQTEDAVNAALDWLAAQQKSDGHWDPLASGAGQAVIIDGQLRSGAGNHADSGIGGLALLSFLAAGHSHIRGAHQQTVRHGLEYLLRVQAQDGNLAGGATIYERMYCHGMAAFALSEAYAMTGDERLQAAVRRAIGYTVAAQHPLTGGWRYSAGDPGDMSQLGWQVMALKSAELAGVSMPEPTRQGVIRFLNSVAAGQQGGLASYKPGYRVTRAMTAEALVCRQFLGMPRSHPAGDEASRLLLEDLPGQGSDNVYYWYYATLGLYQLQGEAWLRWNEALQQKLLTSQRSDASLAGSWDPDPVWGAYGGRVYCTALSTLCLEVYYRFLPMYVEAAGRDRHAK